MGRTRSRSNKDVKQGSVIKRARRTRTDSDTEQPAHGAAEQSSLQSHRASYSRSSLFAYNFIMPLVVEYLNDGDVMARMLTIDKSVKQVLTKYTFKRVCDTSLALAILESDPGVVVSVSRVRATSSDLETLHQVVELNREPLTEVHYHHSDLATIPMNIPRYVTHLELSPAGRSLAIPPCAIPDSVVQLTCSSPLEAYSIPSSVRVVILSMHFDMYRPELIPVSVTNLELTLHGSSTIGMAPGMFPSSLTQLDISGYYKPFSSGVIPSSVTELKCCHQLLTVLDAGVIPNSVTALKIIGYGWAPDRVKANVIPKSVTHLDFDVGQVYFISFPMPPRLAHLSVKSPNDFIGIVPDTVTHLDMACPITHGSLPNSITHLRVTGWGKLEPGVIPSSVTHLDIRSRWNIGLMEPGTIPSSVTHLLFDCVDNQKMVQGLIPNSVTHLTFGPSFNRPISGGVIPDSVTHVEFSDEFNRDLSTKALPRGLKHLCFGTSFNKPIRSFVFPPTLETLVFGDEFNQVIRPSAIPNSVKYLAFGSGFTHRLDETCLPDALTYLEMPRGYVKHDDECWLPASLPCFSHEAKPVSERPDFLDARWNLQWNGD